MLAQCFQANGNNGFKLWYTSGSSYEGSKLTWGTTSENMAAPKKREIIVIRHCKGDNNLFVYNSNIAGDTQIITTLLRTKDTVGNCPLVFGCARADDGIYENFAAGNIYWSKIWYTDLGDDICKNLAMWPHEELTMEACGFRKYYLTDNPSKRCSFSLLAANLLSCTKPWNKVGSNTGGWGASSLNALMNERLYNAFPQQIKSLIKLVKIPSSIGDKSMDVETFDCYVTAPACIELDPTMISEPYINEGTPISYLSTNESRKRAFNNGEYGTYWLRSPNVSYANYVYRVNADGSMYGYTVPYYASGVLIEISF